MYQTQRKYTQKNVQKHRPCGRCAYLTFMVRWSRKGGFSQKEGELPWCLTPYLPSPNLPKSMTSSTVPDRPDLAPYLAIADEFHAHSVIDLGCGTGTLACRFAALRKEVVGIDPAAASLSVAKRKASADRVRWITGTAAQLKGLHADLITMTGNVAQVFVTDEEWMATLRACRDALRPDGRLVFEVRDPTREAWKGWNREQSYKTIEAPGIGTVESWVELMDMYSCRWSLFAIHSCSERTGA